MTTAVTRATPAADPAAGAALDAQLRAQTDALLRSRMRTGARVVAVTLVAMGVSDFAVVASSGWGHAWRAVQLATVLLVAALGPRLGSLQARRRLCLAYVVSLYATAAVVGVPRGDAETYPYAALAAAFATGTTLPWGAWPQALSALAGLGGVFVNRFLVLGSPYGLPLPVATAITIAFAASVYIAWQLDGYRIARDRADIERTRWVHALADAHEQALGSTQAKSALLATMSHEIRTPINVIIGLTEIVLEGELSAEQRADLERARGAALSLLTLVNDVLDLSKIEAGRLRLDLVDVELQPVLRQAVDLLAVAAARKGLTLACSVDPALPPTVRADPVRLRQVLVNLVGNAVKFTEVGGVTVSADAVEAGAGRAQLRLTVRDTGIGIAPERTPQLFQRFTPAADATAPRYGGTGLGLAITAELVELMGGRISVESRPGIGSTFTVDLPLQRTGPSAHAA